MKKTFVIQQKIMKILLAVLIVSVLSVWKTKAQVAINLDNSAPDNSAMLDVKSTTKGILIPRMTSVQRAGVIPPVEGLLVFDTDQGTIYIYHSGSWRPLLTGASAWLVNGNSGIDPSVNFIGTTDNNALVFKVNNMRAGQIMPNGMNAGFGIKALNTTTTGQNNAAFGDYALQFNYTGNENTAAGNAALGQNFTGNDNTAIGYLTLLVNSQGSNNTATGAQALTNNNGNYNTAAGSQSLPNNTSGNGNSAVGYNSLMANTSGSSNTAIGYSALHTNTSGSNNTAIGYLADVSAPNLYNATAIGYNAKVASNNSLVLGGTEADAVKVGIGTSIPSATLDVAGNGKVSSTFTVGAYTLPATDGLSGQILKTNGSGILTWQSESDPSKWSLTGNGGTNPATNFLGTTDIQPLKFRVNNQPSGTIDAYKHNTFYGYQSGALTTGNMNMAFGVAALYKNTTGSHLMAIGDSALYNQVVNAQGYYDNTAIGEMAMFSNTTGSSNLAVGQRSLFSNTTGYWNTAIGKEALNKNQDGYANTATGYQAMYWNTSGNSNTATGNSSLYSNTNGVQNTALGNFSLYSNTTGSQNTAVGRDALKQNYSGYQNTACGVGSLTSNYQGYWNTALGYGALNLNVSGNENVAVGFGALEYNVGSSNQIAVGEYALRHTGTNSALNTCIGVTSLYNNTSGSWNSTLGYNTMYQNTTGNYNVAAGTWALSNNTQGSDNIAIGTAALMDLITGNYNTGVGVNSKVNNYSYSTSVGYYAECTANQQMRFGSISQPTDPVSIGGKVGWSTLSDGRFKKNIASNVPGLDFILQLNPITYNIDNHELAHFLSRPDSALDKNRPEYPDIRYSGFIAQDVEAAAKKVGYEFSGVDAPKNDKDYYSLRYGEFVVPLVKAVQELNQKNASYEQEINELKSELAIQKARLDKLEKLLTK